VKRQMGNRSSIREWPWATVLLAATLTGCECQSDEGLGGGAVIDIEAIVDKDPHAPRPRTDFPKEHQTQDPEVNRFIEHMLEVCERGDYDGFRQLFGTAQTPTGQDDFETVWKNVEKIRVMGLYPDRPDGPESYYAHAVVGLREPDRKGRHQRDVVVQLFSEASEWRMGPASAEIIDRIMSTASQALTQPASQTP